MTRTGGIRGWLLAVAVIALIVGGLYLYFGSDRTIAGIISFLGWWYSWGLAAISFVARSVIRRVADERNRVADAATVLADRISPMTRTGGIRGWLLAAAVIALIGGAYLLIGFIISVEGISQPYTTAPERRFYRTGAIMSFLGWSLSWGIVAISFVARSVIRRVADERDKTERKLMPNTNHSGTTGWLLAMAILQIVLAVLGPAFIAGMASDVGGPPLTSGETFIAVLIFGLPWAAGMTAMMFIARSVIRKLVAERRVYSVGGRETIIRPDDRYSGIIGGDDGN